MASTEKKSIQRIEDQNRTRIIRPFNLEDSRAMSSKFRGKNILNLELYIQFFSIITYKTFSNMKALKKIHAPHALSQEALGKCVLPKEKRNQGKEKTWHLETGKRLRKFPE